MQKERGREYKLVMLHDFLADVKDWMFHNLLQLNLDKTGIIQGEEKLEWLQSVLLYFAACRMSLSLPLLIAHFLSFPPLYSPFFVFLFISQTKHWLLVFGQSHLECVVLSCVFWDSIVWMCTYWTCLDMYLFLYQRRGINHFPLHSLKAWLDSLFWGVCVCWCLWWCASESVTFLSLSLKVMAFWLSHFHTVIETFFSNYIFNINLLFWHNICKYIHKIARATFK